MNFVVSVKETEIEKHVLQHYGRLEKKCSFHEMSRCSDVLTYLTISPLFKKGLFHHLLDQTSFSSYDIFSQCRWVVYGRKHDSEAASFNFHHIVELVIIKCFNIWKGVQGWRRTAPFTTESR